MSTQIAVDPLILVASVLLVVAVVIAGVSRRLQAPSALLFLTIGMLVGDDGLGLVSLGDASVVQNVGVVLLLLILFEGGLTTKPTDLRRAAGPGAVLATLGVVLTSAITGAGAWLVLDIEPITAAMIGAVVGSTDAAAVFAMLRGLRLPPRLAAILKVESGANDPFAIVITLGIVELFVAQPTAGQMVVFAVMQPVIGLVVGGGVGALAVWTLRRSRLSADALYPVLALAFAGVAYGLGVLLGGSGFLAVYVAGLVIGSLARRRRRGIRDFHEGLANVGEIGLFLLLGLLVFPERLFDIAVAGVLVAAILTFVARPIATWLCLLPFRMPMREQVVVGWGGLRGAVPIVLATFPVTAGIPDGQLVFDIAFFVVLVSILLQGSTIARLIAWLGITSDRKAWAPVAEALPIDEIEADLVEVVVSADLPIAGRWLRDVPLPEGMLLAALVRDDRVIIPRGDAVLLADDVLLIVVQEPEFAAERVTAWARSEDGGDGPGSAAWSGRSRHSGDPDRSAPPRRPRRARPAPVRDRRSDRGGYPGPDPTASSADDASVRGSDREPPLAGPEPRLRRGPLPPDEPEPRSSDPDRGWRDLPG